MVDLKDAEAGVGVAVGEGVEAGAEQDVLGDSVGDGFGQLVFGVAAARDEEGAEGDGERASFLARRWVGGAFDLRGVGTEDGDGDGVVEDEGWGVVELVGGAAESYAEGGTGWAGLHLNKECSELEWSAASSNDEAMAGTIAEGDFR